MYQANKARDDHRGATPMVTEFSPVVRGWESHLHGEGEQVFFTFILGGTRDAKRQNSFKCNRR